jgi:hypothetical protein
MMTIQAHFDGKAIIPDEPIVLPIGQSLTVHVDERVPPQQSITGARLAQSGFVGLWKDRKDIGDSLEYARKLRRHAETRGRSPL